MAVSPSQLIHPYESGTDFTAEYRAAMLGDDRSSSPLNLEPSVLATRAPAGKALVRMVLWEHVDQNSPHVIPWLKDADIIAIENVALSDPETNHPLAWQTQTAQSRDNLAVLNYALGAPMTKNEAKRVKWVGLAGSSREEAARQYAADEVPDDGLEIGCVVGLSKLLFPHFIGTGKRVEMLDVEPRNAHEHEKLFHAHIAARNALDEALVKPSGSFTELRDAFSDTADSFTEWVEYREAISSAQINRLAQNNRSKTIAVLYGRGHVLLSRMLDSEAIVMQRVFTDSTPVNGAEYANLIDTAISLPGSFRRATQQSPEQAMIDTGTLDAIAYAVLRDRSLARYLKLGPAKKAALVDEVAATWDKYAPKGAKRRLNFKLSLILGT